MRILLIMFSCIFTVVLGNSQAVYTSSPAFFSDWLQSTTSNFMAFPMAQFVDVNGDGLPDIVEAYTCGSTSLGCNPPSTNYIWLNDGCTWKLSTSSNFTYCPSAQVEFMTEEGAARMLRVSVEEVVSLIAEEKIAALKVNGGFRIHKTALIESVKKH